MPITHQFPLTTAWIAEQLSVVPHKRTLLQAGTETYASFLQAADTDKGRGTLAAKTAGALGGLVRKWKAGLIEHITRDLIATTGIDPSRERIRQFQKDIFGRAQASKDLNRYAVKIRNGGGRADPLPTIPDDLKQAANQMFVTHEDDLRTAFHEAFRL